MGLAKNSLETLLSQCASLAVQLVIGVLIARWLGAEGKGQLYLLVVSINMVASFASLGLGPAAIYFIGKDRGCLPAVVTNLLVTTSIISVVVIAVGWVGVRFFQTHVYQQFPLWLWGLSAVLLPVHLVESLLMQVASALLRIRAINLITLTRSLLYLLLLVLFVRVDGAGVDGGFVAYALSVCVSTGCFAVLVLRSGGRPGAPDWSLLRSSLSFGGKSYLSNTMRMLNLRLDALLVASLASGGAVATGVYSVASNLAELILYVPSSIRLSLFPLIAASSSADANRLTAMACRHTALITLLVTLGAGVGGPLIIELLYGPEFRNAIVPLFILLPGVWLLSQSILFYSDLDGRGRPELSVISRLLALVITVALDLWLIPAYGIIGAAAASLCAYAAEFVVAGLLFTSCTGVTWSDLLFVRSDDLRYYLRVPWPRSLQG